MTGVVVRLVIWVVLGVFGYMIAKAFERQYGHRLHNTRAGAWAALTALLPPIGFLLIAYAFYRETRKPKTPPTLPPPSATGTQGGITGGAASGTTILPGA